MKRVPHATQVTQSLRAATKGLRAAQKGLSDAAGKLMKRGRYSDAEMMVAKGRELQAFQNEISTVSDRWKEIQKLQAGQSEPASSTTPLWGFYQPILRALHELGGKASRNELEPVVERIMRAGFLPGDAAPTSGGKQRWQAMIQRARKHLVEEGWIENGSGSLWHLTGEGQRIATSKTPIHGQATDEKKRSMS